MSLAFRKTKMISFRLSTEEFQALQDACTAQGVRSLSDLARDAMKRAIAMKRQDAVSDEVGELKQQVRQLACDLDRLSKAVENREVAIQGIQQ